MKLEDYEDLPDFMPVEELETLFNGLIIDMNTEKVSKYTFLESLYELTKRQVDTYKPLKKSIRIEIDDMLISLWDSDSFDTTETITYLMLNLGLEKIYYFCKTKIENDEIINKEVKADVENALTGMIKHNIIHQFEEE